MAHRSPKLSNASDGGNLASPGDAVVTGDNLLVAAGRGDRDAFALLYDRVAGAVYGRVLRVVRDPAVAEDVSREVMVELWRTAPWFDPDSGSACAWALGLARRRADERMETTSRSRATTSRRGHRQHRRGAAPPVDSEQLLAMLPPSHRSAREVIELIHHGARSYREAAATLEVPPATVAVWLRAGLCHLRDAASAQPDAGRHT